MVKNIIINNISYHLSMTQNWEINSNSLLNHHYICFPLNFIHRVVKNLDSKPSVFPHRNLSKAQCCRGLSAAPVCDWGLAAEWCFSSTTAAKKINNTYFTLDLHETEGWMNGYLWNNDAGTPKQHGQISIKRICQWKLTDWKRPELYKWSVFDPLALYQGGKTAHVQYL